MHAHSVALHFMFYNFVKIHQTLRVTPAMEPALQVTRGRCRTLLPCWISNRRNLRSTVRWRHFRLQVAWHPRSSFTLP
jgi:hypothetical protein